MDLESFFPSLCEADVRAYMSRGIGPFQGFSAKDGELFCDLVCRNQRLTIGAPTSPGLSNALCYDLDAGLSRLTLQQGVSYTRYADDLFFSTSRPLVLGAVQSEVEQVVASLPLPKNLRVHRAKTRHSSKRGTRRVTGIVLGSDGALSLGRPAKRKVRSQLHRIETMTESERVKFAGFLSYCKGVEPDFINRLMIKYGVARVSLAMSPQSRS
jgi:RNA-directed DNA polymerase